MFMLRVLNVSPLWMDLALGILQFTAMFKDIYYIAV